MNLNMSDFFFIFVVERELFRMETNDTGNATYEVKYKFKIEFHSRTWGVWRSKRNVVYKEIKLPMETEWTIEFEAQNIEDTYTERDQ